MAVAIFWLDEAWTSVSERTVKRMGWLAIH